jgi:hypothetical protein
LSDEPLSLDALFASEGGDAPGQDPAVAPRPEGGRRVLTTRVEPARYGAFVYATDDRAEDALAHYDAAIRARQFEMVSGGASGKSGRAYRRGLVDVLVTASEGERGTTLSIVESHYSTASSTAAGGARE